MPASTLGFFGKVVLIIALLAFIGWQGKLAIKEYKDRKAGKGG